MKIEQRYAEAISRGDVSSTPRSTFAGADVLGAMAFAAKPVQAALAPGQKRRGHPLAIALLRMFLLGDKEAKAVCALMTRMAVSKAHEWRQPIGEAGADIMAGLVLAWHRDSVCKVCGGHGFRLLFDAELGEGRGVVSDQPCDACHGTGRREFDGLFPSERVELARWLRAKVERETALAGPAAMRRLAPKLEV